MQQVNMLNSSKSITKDMCKCQCVGQAYKLVPKKSGAIKYRKPKDKIRSFKEKFLNALYGSSQFSENITKLHVFFWQYLQI